MRNIIYHQAKDWNSDLTSGLLFSNIATILVPFLCAVNGDANGSSFSMSLWNCLSFNCY